MRSTKILRATLVSAALAAAGLAASPAVPEPATWAMMIMGFGLMGEVLRLRMALAPVRI